MKINDVERITGLTKKAIRLYESKELIHISRDENGYRNYSDGDIEMLKTIRQLRRVGIAIADIKLYVFGVLSLEEMLDKRKAEILKESGIHSEMYRICESISGDGEWDDGLNSEILTENEEIRQGDHGALAVGIDLGTTNISAVVYDLKQKKQLEVYSLPHHSYVCTDVYSEQNASVILDKAEKLLFHILRCFSGIVSIGLTGQMHGIVYIDAEGKPISHLINWQDKRADQPLMDGKTVSGWIKEKTGEAVATGYGIATHCYNMHQGLVPAGAAGFCSIMDLFGMRICGMKKAVTHVSVAASFGLFDLHNGSFMKDHLAVLAIDENFLPRATGKSIIIGECRGIPVSVAIGDNQASFLGSVRENAKSILVNIGTGSQISAVSEEGCAGKDVELRPFVEGKYLACGSALCGGFAYSMLESFFRSYAISAGMQDVSQYKILNQLAREAYESGKAGLTVDVSFFGKRSDPDCRGAIQMIDRQNFTPSDLVLGVLKGMCQELYGLYGNFAEKKTHIVASGGAVRKNEVLQKLIGDCFGMPVTVHDAEEEAALGAALFSAFAIGKIQYDNGFSEYIK